MKNHLLFALALSATLIAACSKNDSKSGGTPPSVLGEALKPGYTPDGRQVSPLSAEDKKKAQDIMAGTTAVAKAVVPKIIPDQGRGQGPVLSSGRQIDPQYSNKLEQDINRYCQGNALSFDPETTQDRQGNVVSGSWRLSSSSTLRGTRCPVDSSTSFSGQANFAVVLDDQDQLQSLSGGGSLQFRHLTTAIPSVTTETGFKSLGMQGSLSASANGNFTPNSQNIRVALQTDIGIEMDTNEFGPMQGRVVAEVDVDQRSSNSGSQSEESVAVGSAKLALLFEGQGLTILLQVFVEPGPDGKAITKAYLNGEEISLEDEQELNPGPILSRVIPGLAL